MIVLRAQKSIFVGDTRQLPPHIWDPMRDVAAQPRQAHDRTTRPAAARSRGAARRDRTRSAHTPQEREARRRADALRPLRRTPQRHRARGDAEHAVPDAPADRRARQPTSSTSDIGGLRPRPRTTGRPPRAGVRRRDARAADRHPRHRRRQDGKSKHRSAEVDHIRRELKRPARSTPRTSAPPPNGPERLGVAVITPYAAQARTAAQRPRPHAVPRAERPDRDRRPLPGRRGPGRHPQHRRDDRRGVPEDPEPDQRRDQPRPGPPDRHDRPHPRARGQHRRAPRKRRQVHRRARQTG